MSAPDFYMASSEGYIDEPRRCWRVKRLATEHRDDFLLVRVNPPILGRVKGQSIHLLDLVLVATRHEGRSLFPITEWPVFVFVARPLVGDPQLRDHLRADETQLIAWAELYRTEEDARGKAM